MLLFPVRQERPSSSGLPCTAASAFQARQRKRTFRVLCSNLEPGDGLQLPGHGKRIDHHQGREPGKCVLDCGTTKSLGSVHAIEQIMRLSRAGVEAVDRENRPLFSFENSTKTKCLSTVHLRVSAGGAPGILRIHGLDQGHGPVLLSFENNLMVLRGVNNRKMIPPGAGQVRAPPPAPDRGLVRSCCIDTVVPVPDLKSFLQEPGGTPVSRE